MLTCAELEERSRSLGTPIMGFPGATVDNRSKRSSEVRVALQEWFSASESDTLWITGPPCVPDPSERPSSSAFAVSMNSRPELPVITHQCQNSGSEFEVLTTMVYSVIIQLASLVPKTFSTNIDLSLGRFSSLDRTRESLPHALLLLEDILTLAPRQLAVIIDDIPLCEDRLEEKLGTGRFLRRFVTIWKKGQVGRVLKVLYITDGWCRVLWRLFNICDA